MIKAALPDRSWFSVGDSGEQQGVHLTAEAKQVWIASYAASVVRQVYDYLHDGHGSPDESMMAGFREDAATVADMVLGIE